MTVGFQITVYWEPSRGKDESPAGREDLKNFVDDMHKRNFKVGIWWSPLIAEPHSDVAKTHPDWFTYQKDGNS
ncbi:MAG: alpha-galactosidase [Melioribacteraceae bacterium]|nr:alpha-galactosidase [Melioribacteraceae bacterium]